MKNIKTSILLFTATLLLSCLGSKSQTFIESCTLDSAIQIAKNHLRKRGYKLNELDLIHKIHDDYFIIIFTYKQDTDGGGAEITVSKNDCQIIKKLFYQ